MRLKMVVSAFTLLLMTAAGIWAQPVLPAHAPRIGLVEVNDERTPALGRVAFDVPEMAYRELWRQGSALVVDFPLPQRDPVILELTATRVIAPDARFMVNDENGMYEHPGPDMRFFRGRVAGEPDSQVALNMFQGRIAGFVRIGEEEFGFGPKDYDLARPGARDMSVWDPAVTEIDVKAACAGDEIHDFPTGKGGITYATKEGAPAPAIDGSTVLLAYTAIEGTAEWVAHHGSVSAAETYTLDLIAQISAYWETDVLVQMQVPFSLMNTNAATDGYTDNTLDTSVLLPEMRTKWRGDATLQTTVRTVAQLFSEKTDGGGSGRAYRNTGLLCGHTKSAGTTASDFGVNIISGLGGSWEKRLVGHEIGHNYSSPHTHCYTPEIDECYNAEGGCFSGTETQVTGTMMSYCDVRVSVIHQRVKDEQIRPEAEAAYGTCIDVAGSPGDVRDQLGQGLSIGSPTICASDSFQLDDGGTESASAYFGTAQAAWVNRFTPACHPFKVTDVDLLTWHSSVQVGRAVRILVYQDGDGDGDPTNGTLIYTEDTTISAVSFSVWNEYTLTNPPTISAGDMYVGFYDLDNDAADTYIMANDTNAAAIGNSFRQANSTDPSGFSAYGSGGWMIRAAGTGLGGDAIELTWGTPCNDATVPGQDFAVYQGDIDTPNTWTSLTCSTGGGQSYVIENPPDGATWIVVPATSVVEGSYGQNGSGSDRSPASSPCFTQATEICP